MTLTALDGNEPRIIDPITGESIDPRNVDELVEAFARLEIVNRNTGETMRAIRSALGDLSYGDARTRRVRGEFHRVKLEFPGPSWNQKKLKQAMEEWPEIAREFIRVEKYAPNLREVKKLENEAGNSDFMAFRKLLREAEEPSQSPPRVVVETDSAHERREQEWTLRGQLKASLSEEG